MTTEEIIERQRLNRDHRMRLVRVRRAVERDHAVLHRGVPMKECGDMGCVLLVALEELEHRLRETERECVSETRDAYHEGHATGYDKARDEFGGRVW